MIIHCIIINMILCAEYGLFSRPWMDGALLTPILKHMTHPDKVIC